MTGKGKITLPYNPTATPDYVAQSAMLIDKDPFTIASYTVGKKTMFEMTCAANATGCTPMQNSIPGPEANLDTVLEIFALKCDGDIIEFPGAVYYVQGSAMAGGVFVTVRVDDRRTYDLHIGEHLDDIAVLHLTRFLSAPISHVNWMHFQLD